MCADNDGDFRRPAVAANPIWPVFGSAIPVAIAYLILTAEHGFLVQASYSEQAKLITALTFAPIGEESLKVGLGLLDGGAPWPRSQPFRDCRRTDQRRWCDTWTGPASLPASSVFLAVALLFAGTEIGWETRRSHRGGSEAHRPSSILPLGSDSSPWRQTEDYCLRWPGMQIPLLPQRRGQSAERGRPESLPSLVDCSDSLH